ncbi:MAG: hypothetical protein EAX96_16455 [Candidatus Lokiarchaeota archaeon]|nr:hypothetical protein [Candidatus Lokiarchaeota archaeon]
MQLINFAIVAILLGIVATMLLNIGKGVSKFGLKKLGEKIEPKKKYTAIWIIGILITSSSVIVNIFALDFGEASIVAALAGVGLVSLIIFSYFILNENLDKIVYSGITLTICGTIIVGLFSRETHQEAFNFGLFWILFIIFLIPVLLCIIYTFKNEFKYFGFIFGAFAGLLSGFAVVLEKMGLIVMGGVKNFFIMLFTMGGLLFVIAIILGLTATSFTQYGLTRGKASILVPAFNSFYIVIPVTCEYLVFNTALHVAQIIGIILILIGIILMTAFKPEPLDASPLDK